MTIRSSIWTVVIGLVLAPVLDGAGLNPSQGSWDRQLAGAEAAGYSRAGTKEDVYEEVSSGKLVQLPGNDDYDVKELVQLPYARAEVLLFVEQLAAGYRADCGEPLVVTSLIRPKSRRPRNSHPRSTHALGVAIDFRRSWSRRCRGWLEANLLHLESEGVLEATREREPPHYHVVLFTDPYIDHLARLEHEASRLAAGEQDAGPRVVAYVIQRGDTLWRIASRYGVELSTLRDFNDLRGSTIRPGQLLRVPLISAPTGAF